MCSGTKQEEKHSIIMDSSICVLKLSKIHKIHKSKATDSREKKGKERKIQGLLVGLDTVGTC